MTKKQSVRNASVPNRLNLGCGRCYHRDWTNLDLESDDPKVIKHDVTKGIPFEQNNFETVYHSHILEHLAPDQGQQLISECYRVLKPGGILRIVVPDLERIAKLYLETHDQAWSGNEDSTIDYNWMKLELLDQLVRQKSGGRMGQYMASREIKNSDFVRSRVGVELSVCQSPKSNLQSPPTLMARLAKSTDGFRHRVARRLVGWLLGSHAKSAFDEGMFRSQGEIHRWMYDRFSLRSLCEQEGFENFRVCGAEESSIGDYANFELDAELGQVRKPDSIFVECQKPLLAGQISRAA